MLSMSIGISHRLSISIPCPLCKAREGHNTGCPTPRLESLRREQKHIRCPKCDAHAIDLNLEDYYECRECHTQYTTGAFDDNWERTNLIVDMDAPISEGYVAVLVRPNKGEGKFRIDEAIAEVQKEIEALRTKKQRRKKS